MAPRRAGVKPDRGSGSDPGSGSGSGPGRGSGRGRGKVILLGEHAVVYGYPAVAGALAAGVTCRAEPSPSGPIELVIPRWGGRARPGDAGPLAAALEAIAGALGAESAPLTVSAEGELPPGAGLGSSAALSVALARALAAATGAGDDAAARAAEAGEAAFHGRPSGLDGALAARGGLGVYRREEGLRPIPGAAPVPLAVGLTAEARRTEDLVLRVAQAREGSERARARLRALGEAAELGAEALGRRDAPALGALMSRAHEDLCALGVSTPALDALVGAAISAGALGAKLTGAGGGGAVIALAPGRERAIARRWQCEGYDAFVCEAGAPAGGDE